MKDLLDCGVLVIGNSDDIFSQCRIINDFINNNKMREAREHVIRLLAALENYTGENAHKKLVNHLVRNVGLFPYIKTENNDVSFEDKLVKELFRVKVGGEGKVLHLEQSLLLKKLLSGKNVAVSAPTSFGKSFIIDAFIENKKPKNVVIIVPTIALTDETRRRLTKKFSKEYKIITTSDASLQEKNIIICPQERIVYFYDKLSTVDILIVDEFYKISADEDVRSSVLINCIEHLGKKSIQKYYLTPNIEEIQDNDLTKDMEFLKLDFQTVITNRIDIYKKKPKVKKENKESWINFKKNELTKFVKENKINEKTIIYTASHRELKDVSVFLDNVLQCVSDKDLCDFSDWLYNEFGPTLVLSSLIKKGVGVHNGRLPRYIGQILIDIFEKNEKLTYIISTSSIIEGVNTQAKNIILWSCKKSNSYISYFTYQNIAGRAGRMFKYFIGNVYVFDNFDKIKNKDLNLNIEYNDEYLKKSALDLVGYGSHSQSGLGENPVIDFNSRMEKFFGIERWKSLKRLPIIINSKSEDIVSAIHLSSDDRIRSKFEGIDYEQPTLQDLEYLIRVILKIKPHLIRQEDLRKFLIIAPKYILFNREWWSDSAVSLRDFVQKERVPVDFIFEIEKKITYNISSVSSLLFLILSRRGVKCSGLENLSSQLANLMMPRMVMQLEEYGLPRSLSRKINEHTSIDLQNDNLEISEIINKFKEYGIKNLQSSIPDLHVFEKYFLQNFYEGIS